MNAITDTNIAVEIGAARTVEGTPRAYRLGRRKGELVLQGAFFWRQGWGAGGPEWRDIPIEDLDADDQRATAQRSQ